MAFSVALRRAAAASAPLAARAAKEKPTLLRTLLLRNILPLQQSPSSLSHFSSLSTEQQQSSDGDLDLVGVLDSEIKFASDDYKKVEKLPKGLPFEIEDAKGTSVIVLRRMYGREEIEVVVSIPSPVAGDETADDENGSEFEIEKRNEVDGDGKFCIPLTVNVSKGGGGPSLELECTAYPDEIEIDAVSLRSEGDCDGVSYEGPRFKKLQKALHKYLERRGISPLTTNLLYEYMINKDNREYLLWLKNLRWFMEE